MLASAPRTITRSNHSVRVMLLPQICSRLKVWRRKTAAGGGCPGHLGISQGQWLHHDRPFFLKNIQQDRTILERRWSMTVSMTAVSVHVKDMEKSKAWYLSLPGAVLEFEHAGEPGGRPAYASIRLGKGHINLVQLEREVNFHIEIGTDDLPAVREHLAAVGIGADGPQPSEWGEDGMVIRDPDGNLVEFDDHLR
jgi:catechol 2,3-dioxygenase-like lactoylglutathione lyase family enzyme